MEFWLGKIAWAIFAPSHLLVILLFLFLITPMGRGWKSFLVTFISFFLFLMVCLPVGDWALVPLEQCGGKVQLPLTVDGAVVLGGAVENTPTVATGEAQFNSAVGRFHSMLKIMKTYPQATVVYSGGPGSPKYPDFREADTIKRLTDEIGLDGNRLMLENMARNTPENAAFSQPFFSKTPGQNWLVVTSAYHMPRALELFRKAGEASQTHFYPYASDFLTAQRVRFEFTFDLPGNLAKLDIAVKEYAGLIINKVLGRSREFMPCEQPQKAKLS